MFADPDAIRALGSAHAVHADDLAAIAATLSSLPVDAAALGPMIRQANYEVGPEFVARFQASAHSLRAFEQSSVPDDWRDLMRLFLVRRTRQYIIRNYAQFDEPKGRYFVELNAGRFYFPVRQPRRLNFPVNEAEPHDQYARLHHERVVQVIGELNLPRYGLQNYLVPNADRLANAEEKIDAAFRDQPLVEAGLRHALAVAYLALGRTEAAHRYAARARDLRLRHLGPEHPQTLDSTFYLAVELQGLGK